MRVKQSKGCPTSLAYRATAFALYCRRQRKGWRTVVNGAYELIAHFLSVTDVEWTKTRGFHQFTRLISSTGFFIILAHEAIIPREKDTSVCLFDSTGIWQHPAACCESYPPLREKPKLPLKIGKDSILAKK